MDFGAIISFIAIVFISSLFNKDKNTAKTSRTSRTPVQPNRPFSSNKPTTKPNTVNKNNKRSLPGGLEDLFKEIRTEFDKSFINTETAPNKYTSTEEVSGSVSMENDYEKKETRKIESNKGSNIDSKSVYDGEIGKNEIPIEFNRKSIIQGVIMSEILQKPKSLRR